MGPIIHYSFRHSFRDFLRQALGLAVFVLGILISCLWAILSLPLYAIHFPAGQWCHRLFGKTWLFLLCLKVDVYGLENIPAGGAVLAPNHESIVDIPLLASLPLAFRWISKEQVGRIPFIGLSMRAMGCYFVNRNRATHDLNVMKEVEDGLLDGSKVLIFPEGTRTRTGQLLPFKKGAFKCVQNTGVPLIPIAITGTYKIAPPGSLPTLGHHLVVRIGKPLKIPPQGDLLIPMEQFRKTLTKLLSEDRPSGYDTGSHA